MKKNSLNEKLQQIYCDLKVNSLLIDEVIKQMLVHVFECLDAFAARSANLNRTSLNTHRIKTGKARPF